MIRRKSSSSHSSPTLMSANLQQVRVDRHLAAGRCGILYEGQGRHYCCLPDAVLVAQDYVQSFIVNATIGIGDAIDLSRKLAATLAGWGGFRLLARYEQKRRAIGSFNRGCAGTATIGVSVCLARTCPRCQLVRR